MRISLLLGREPFGGILGETLPPLLSALGGRPHAVRWQGHGRVDGARGGQAWLCNARLNAIFRPAATAASLAPVVREFSRSMRSSSPPIQRAHAAAAISRPTA